MMLPRVSVCVVLGLSAFLGPRLQAAVQVTPFRLEECRIAQYAKDSISRTPAGLKLTLSLSGPEAEASVRYGDLKLEEAVDDQGTSLLPAKNVFNDPAKFRDYANAFFRKAKFGNAQPAAPEMEINLALPKRNATKIARLRGSFTLAEQGKVRSLEMTNLTGAGPRNLAVPEAGDLRITIAGEKTKSFDLQISGDEGALESLEVVDASGNKVSTGMSSWSFNGGPVHKSLDLRKPVDSSMKLVARVAVDRKLHKVALDLKDIALP